MALRLHGRALMVLWSLGSSIAVWKEIGNMEEMFPPIGAGNLEALPAGSGKNVSLARAEGSEEAAAATMATATAGKSKCDKSRASDVPFLIGMGVQKSGTTSLSYALNRIQLHRHDLVGTDHPSTLRSLFASGGAKEHHYFDGSGSEAKTAAYIESFGVRVVHKKNNHKKKACKQQCIGIDLTPSYLCFPGAARRICEAFLKPKILVMLREPSARALSGYMQNYNIPGIGVPGKVRPGWQRDFENDVMAEIAELGMKYAGPVQSWAQTVNMPNSHTNLLSVVRGLYKGQLENIFKFHNKENVMVLQSELLFAEPAKYVAKIMEFVGYGVEKYDSSHVISAISSFPDINKNVRPEMHEGKCISRAVGALKVFYKARNEELAKFLATAADPKFTFFDLGLWQ